MSAIRRGQDEPLELIITESRGFCGAASPRPLNGGDIRTLMNKCSARRRRRRTRTGSADRTFPDWAHGACV